MSIAKNRMAQSGEAGNLDTTSGYTMNARPAPEKEHFKYKIE